MQHSTFCIKYFKDKDAIELIGFYEKNFLINAQKEFDFTIYAKKNNFDFNSIEENDLDYLYHKIFISKHQSNIDGGIKQFINFYKEITHLKNILNKLYCSYGYSLMNDIMVDIDKKNISCNFQNKEYSLKEIKEEFYEIKEKCKISFEKIIKINKEIRFFNGKQLYLIYSSIKNKNYNEIKDLLRCMSNDLIKNFDDNIFEIDDNKIVQYEYMLETIKKYISKQLKYNGIKIEQIYQFNKLNDSFKNELLNGFYFYIKENDLDLFLLTIFFNLTGNYPSINNLLLCNKDTSFEEIQSIINQAINCEFSNLFIIAKCELLNSHTKRKLIHKLKKKHPLILKIS